MKSRKTKISCSSEGTSEINALQAWVRSLTEDELVRAMEFRFNVDDDTNGLSHEYEILSQMVELQPPPKTPVHPRALGFKPATNLGATDGKNEEERTRKDRFRRPRLFKFTERDSKNFPVRTGRSGSGVRRNRLKNSRRASSRYEVLARKFVTNWGEVLSVGCTSEEQDADEYILEGTGVRQGSDLNSLYCTFTASTHGKTKSIHRMLQVASRGKFLSLPLDKSKSGHIIAFCAPWLDPINDFVSLPMYLASRFEVALWESYRVRQNETHLSLRENSPFNKLPKETIQRALCKAVVASLSNDILRAPSLAQLRDSMLWNLLDTRLNNLLSYEASAAHSLDEINITPLLEIGTKTADLRRLIQKHMQESLALELQSDLIRSLGNERQASNGGEVPARRRRPKKKKRNRRRSVLPVVHEEKKTSCASKSTAEVREGEESSDDGIENFCRGRQAVPPTLPSKNRNRNTITVLMLLDEVVDSVFERVGLSVSSDDCSGRETSLTGERETRAFHEGGSSVAVSTEREVGVPFDSGGERDDLNERTSPAIGQDGYCDGPTSGVLDPTSPVVQPRLFSEEDDEVLQRRLPHEYGSYDSDLFGFTPSNLSFDFNFRRYQYREESLFTDLFLSAEDSEDPDDMLLASSTVASIASSSGIDEYDSVEGEANDDVVPVSDTRGKSSHLLVRESDDKGSVSERNIALNNDLATLNNDVHQDLLVEKGTIILESSEKIDDTASENVPQYESPPRSPPLKPPKTPPPQLSPILVSLADLKNLRRRTTAGHSESLGSSTPKDPASKAFVAGSLPSSPMTTVNNGLTPSWSREDLRISSSTDEKNLRRKGQGEKKRNAAAASLNVRLPAGSDEGFRDLKGPSNFEKRSHTSKEEKWNHNDSCVQSESREESQNCNLGSKVQNTDETDNMTSIKDGSTTISSAVSAHDPEDIPSLREERNSFRDMCLTLGAEVAMLRNLLAAEKGTKFYPSADYSDGYPVYGHSPHSPGVPPLFQGIPTGMTSSRTVAALSDAGIHRGDQESINVSEDGTDIVGPHDNPGNLRAVHLRRMDSATFPGSDASLEHTVSAASDFRTLNREAFGSVPSHGLHSRLTKDIMNFIHSTSLQLRKQSGRRRLATERLTRLIKTLWPRAQLKLYGSHVSGNCLPSSDLDFVICLPAVHKNAPAVAPGVLEGMNAINETSQKLLARKLKGESWIDPNSIKIVERTAVPVIKVSTKDSRSRMLQLDISFDGPEHRGLPAIELVKTMMQELPMIRPLLLVLKQFLLDRGLLTAFTGGLSSHCLFLLIARYLQEQPSSWGDCGSLLMGFLDFYGNSFDPRATGVSVSRRQYFSRSNCVPYPPGPQMWNMPHTPRGIPSPGPPIGDSADFLRRHSFSDKAGNSGKGEKSSKPTAVPQGMRPPRFQPPSSSTRKAPHHISTHEEQDQHASYDHVGKPYTYDPLFVEDPLSPGNNVGRNAFRIYQVQRAFSDAHRALVASLEWDIYSTNDLHDGVDYPLLKCLLQSEDAFYELEDPR